MVEGHTKEGLVASDGEVLKTKGDYVKIQKDATILKFPSGNQSDENNATISKLDAEKHTILQLSEENSCKLLLLALLWKIWIPARKCQTANFRNASLTVKNS
jgi:hypothetical protein